MKSCTREKIPSENVNEANARINIGVWARAEIFFSPLHLRFALLFGRAIFCRAENSETGKKAIVATDGRSDEQKVNKGKSPLALWTFNYRRFT